jgi:chromosome segregation ATPase
MTDEPDPDRVTSLPASASPSSQKVMEVLCREVGTSHPDGALRQIRTMKRLLRSHYRVKQRLERYGVDSLSDAVSHIADLHRQVRQYREQQRENALDRMEVLDDLMDAFDAMQRRLRARPDAASDSARDVASSPDANDALDEVNELISALERALDEIRLELWLHQSYDEDSPSTPVASTAGELLDRLADRIDTAREAHERLRKENERLYDRNDSLQRDVERLETTAQQKEARIEELERELERRSPSAQA